MTLGLRTTLGLAMQSHSQVHVIRRFDRVAEVEVVADAGVERWVDPCSMCVLALRSGVRRRPKRARNSYTVWSPCD